MASYTETERLEEIEAIEVLLENLTETYTGDPILLVQMKEFIESLNPKHKIILYLRLFGFSIEDISKELGIREDTIRKRLESIRKKSRSYV